VCVCVCFVRFRSLRRADHSSRDVLPNVACLKQCNFKTPMMMRPRPTRAVMKKRETKRKPGVRTTNWVTETFSCVVITVSSELHVPTSKAADLIISHADACYKTGLVISQDFLL